MLKKNIFRIVLSVALTLTYLWTACRKQEVKMEARSKPRSIKLEAKDAQTNQPIFAETSPEKGQPAKP